MNGKDKTIPFVKKKGVLKKKDIYKQKKSLNKYLEIHE